MAIDTNYQVQPGESTAAYNTRVAAYNSSKNGGGTPQGNTTTLPGSDTSSAQQPVQSSMTDTLIQKLLGQSDIISSQSTGLESKINDIISGVKSGETANEGALNLSYQGKEADAQKQGATALLGAQEGQRGFAVNQAALQQIQDQTKKSVNDLEMQKQQLILQGQASAAGQITQLQLQQLQFQQQAQQQVYSNLLGITGISQQKDAAATAAAQFQQQQKFQSTQAMGALATQYGLTPRPGESLDSLYARAATDMGVNSPAALAIKQAQSQIAANNAQTAESLAKANAAKPLTAIDLKSLASAYNSVGPAILGQISSANDQAAVIQQANADEIASYSTAAQSNFDNGIPKSALVQQVMGDQSIVNKNGAIQAINNVYGNNETPTKKASAQGTYTPFQAPTLGTAGAAAFGSGIAPASADAVAALKKSLQGTAFGGF